MTQISNKMIVAMWQSYFDWLSEEERKERQEFIEHILSKYGEPLNHAMPGCGCVSIGEVGTGKEEGDKLSPSI